MFAAGCGLLVVLIRQFAAYPEGVTYAILLMNILTPLIDKFSKRRIYGEVKQHG
ncbi:MAG: RnfABCDGE type electron transport complex subunit D [Oscillospiraceae bacterium]|nr:RnfABCDGE type electron transport complex subunit D [Oscillospiraceae bacterium]